MNIKMTRRDFLNATLLGAGAMLLELPAPLRLFAQSDHAWGGYSGVGDYSASNGNTEDVLRYAHAMRDGKYETSQTIAADTGEIFDLVIIGGGLSGLGAASYFKKAARTGQTCLVIENHPLVGGEAKRNEFSVNGQRLIGPQGANSFVVLDDQAMGGYDIYSDLGLPSSFTYQNPSLTGRKLNFDRTNFGFMLWYDSSPSFGYFFEGQKEPWASDIWNLELGNTPFASDEKKDFMTWRNSSRRYYEGNNFREWLDTMTYKDYLEKVMGLSPAIPRFVDPVLAASIGLGSDAISAYGAYQVSMPGFQGFPGGFSRPARVEKNDWHSFPGGNDGLTRQFLKKLIPAAIRGENTFEDIQNSEFNLEAVDRTENAVRIRLGSLAVRVAHSGGAEKSEYVRVDYVTGGAIFSLKARSVVMASGSWVTRRIVRGLPQKYYDAYGKFYRSPMLIVNVAVTNWRFLDKLGLTGCRWFDGFGFSCNIRQSMIIGDYRPPLDPDKPALITFYVPFFYPGLPIREQGVRGRTELLSTSYAEYEKRILAQMSKLFGSEGFDAGKDVAGIVLNRWGHAYVNPQPGFYFGSGGMPAARTIIRSSFGRIAFGHSELNGHQHWLGAVTEGRRAAQQAMDAL